MPKMPRFIYAIFWDGLGVGRLMRRGAQRVAPCDILVGPRWIGDHLLVDKADHKPTKLRIWGSHKRQPCSMQEEGRVDQPTAVVAFLHVTAWLLSSPRSIVAFCMWFHVS